MTERRRQAEQNVLTRPERFENARVLVVDDNIDLLKLISIRLKPMKLELKTVTSAEEALSILSLWSADLVITDLQMPGMSGMELFEVLHEKNQLLPVIILTAHGTIPDAVEATQAGVASYLTKPFDSDALIQHIQSALLASGFSSGSSGGSEQSVLVHNDGWHSNIITQSPAMEALFQQIESLADGRSLVVFEGEPGTGKDEFARALHACSARSAQPLVHLACTSIPADLLETELFGRVGDESKGIAAREGLLAQANQGSLLLSDFNEAPARLLDRLMNALISGQATPVDSDRPYTVDVRAITTTVEIGQYGPNSQEIWRLGEKLEITVLSVPSLNERREDIPLLIKHCLDQLEGKSELQFSNKATQQLLAAEWPGNVRQLLNVVKQCARMSKTKIMSEALVNNRLGSPAFRIQPLTTAHRAFERDYLTEILKVTNGNVTRAASMAKRNRTEFHRLLKKHKIEAKSFRQ